MEVALLGKGYWGSKVEHYIPFFFKLKHVADSKFDKEVIWSDKEVEAVFIVTPMDTHFDIIKEALLHDKHVFSAKPLTLRYVEALELKELAEERGLSIAVDYTQAFSPSILAAKKHIDDIGHLDFIEMSTKHLGRFFQEYDVYWLLAAHHLSILDMFIDLDECDFTFVNALYHNYVCTTGSIMFQNGRIDVSTNFPSKELFVNLYGTNGTIQYNALAVPSLTITNYNKSYGKLPDELVENCVTYTADEQNNLYYSVQYFKNIMEGKRESNIDTAIKITKILERRDEKSCY